MEKELKAIQAVENPITQQILLEQFRQAGLRAGSIVLVHSSLSSIGFVSGGAAAVVLALMEALTADGTLIMPTHSGDLSDPAYWQYPPVPETWWPLIRESMPAYNPDYTPSRGMGCIPELFRTMPGVKRSFHPQYSFAAWGRYATEITSPCRLEDGLGERSPLGLLYALPGSQVMLLGCGFDSNTSFHLGEQLAGTSPLIQQGAPIVFEGKRVWYPFMDIDWNSDTFIQIGSDFEKTGLVSTHQIGNAKTKIFPQQQAVDFAKEWLLTHKKTD